MEGTMSAADIAAVTRPNMYGYGYGDGGFGGNSWMWLIAFLFLGGGFGGYGRGYDRAATVEDLNNASNFTRLENQVGMNGQAIAQGFTNIGNGICQAEYQNLQNYNALSKELANCCCENKQISLENRYLAAQNTAEINANVTTQAQKILDALAQNKIESLQAQVSKLQLDQALCNVVRYPTTNVYATSCNPFAGFNGCGCQNI